MGGRGSGRHWQYSSKATTDGMLKLDVRRLERDNLLRAGQRFGWAWSRDGEPIGKIQIAAHEHAITLDYRFQERGGDWETLNYEVALLSQPCNFGGERRWFACPARGCGKRVAILYGGRIFACRKCYGLVYESQREARHYRYMRRANKIKERLGWVDDWGLRPKGMHHRTFKRLTDELSGWQYASDIAFLGFWSDRLGDMFNPDDL